MATLFEYYNTGDTGSDDLALATWRAQTFTPATAHKITSVKLKLYRVGSPGTIIVSIRATDGSGHPTGADLCSGTTDGDTLTTDIGGEWREITLGAGYDLLADTKYAIVGRALDAYGANYVKWRREWGTGAYAGGNYEYSTHSGDSWDAAATSDFMFEDWGEPPVTEKTGSDTGSGVGAHIALSPVSQNDAGSGADVSVGGISFYSSDVGYCGRTQEG